METIKIGRDPSSQIFLNHEMISRHHAILRIYPTGKMELVSMGANGTKLNGALVRPNVVYRVKRSDMISFADRYQLDWNQIHNPRKKYYIAGIILLACLLLFALVYAGKAVYRYFNPCYESTPAAKTTVVESTSPEVTESPNVTEETTPVTPEKVEDNKSKGFSKKDFFPELGKEKNKDKNTKKDSVKTSTKDNGKKDDEKSSKSKDSVGIKSKVII